MNFPRFAELVKEADATYNVMYMTTIFVAMIKEDSTLNFSRIEKQLRETGSQTYLLAAPADNAPAGTMPFKPLTKEPQDYWLYICLQGEIEAKQQMEDFQIPSYHKNLSLLQRTGVLMFLGAAVEE